MTPPLPAINGRQLLRALARDDWTIVRTGDHHILPHPSDAGRVIVPNQPSRPIEEGTLRAILKHAGLTAEYLHYLL